MLDSRRCSAFFAALFLLATALSTRAQISANGYIDTAFNPSCINMPSVNFTTRALLVLDDGKILAGGNYSSAFGACRNGFVRLRTNGVTDPTFTSPLLNNNFVTGLARQLDGKIIISGFLSDFNSAFPVARLGANGAVDNTFARFTDAGLVGNAVVVQPDDKVIVGGSAGTSAGFIRRLNFNGTIDNTFSNSFSVTDRGPSEQGIGALALQSGKVLVGGSFSIYNDGKNNLTLSGLARLNDNGSLDVTFRAPLTNADVRAILVQPNGKILVAGSFLTFDGVVRSLIRLNSDGTRDLGFTPVGVNITGLSLAVEPDGKILMGHTLGIMRVTTNGVVDTTFGPGNAPGFFGTDALFASAVARSAEGNVLVGAWRVSVGSTSRRGVIRLFDTLPPRPVILDLSTNTAVDAGMNVTFSVMATGAPPISYQWRKKGVKINGATSTNLTLLDVDSTDVENYTVVVTNPGGSVTSSVVRLSVNFFLSTIAVTIQPQNGGSVSPSFQNRALEIGREYMLTAKPFKGFLFTNWSGFETSSNPVLTFTMRTNEVLQANFVPSPFIPVRGAYTGLFYDLNAPAHENAGGFALTLDDKGGFGGTVTMGRNKRRFRGTFSLERVATVNIPGTTTLPSLALALELDTQAGAIGGTVTMGTNEPSTLVAFRNAFSAKLNPAPNAGFYNAVLPSTNDPALAPPGDGFVPITITTAGRVSGRGVLADGTGWSFVSATSKEAWVPVYVPLYAGRGSIFGWLTVTNTGANDVAGTLWRAQPTSDGGFAVGGSLITTNTTFNTVGSRFTPVTRGTPVLNLNPGLAVLIGSSGSISNIFTLGGDNKITGSDGLNLSITTSKGLVTGSFVNPSTSRKRTVRGIALQNQNEARGFFLPTDASDPPTFFFSKGRLFVGSLSE